MFLYFFKKQVTKQGVCQKNGNCPARFTMVPKGFSMVPKREMVVLLFLTMQSPQFQSAFDAEPLLWYSHDLAKLKFDGLALIPCSFKSIQEAVQKLQNF